jgi:hypothetical protein
VYRTVYQPSGLGFSLKPPAWLRNIVSTVTGGAQQTQAAVNAVSAQYAPPPASSGSPTGAAMAAGEMPGWVIPAGIGLLAVLLFMRGRKS